MTTCVKLKRRIRSRSLGNMYSDIYLYRVLMQYTVCGVYVWIHCLFSVRMQRIQCRERNLGISNKQVLPTTMRRHGRIQNALKKAPKSPRKDTKTTKKNDQKMAPEMIQKMNPKMAVYPKMAIHGHETGKKTMTGLKKKVKMTKKATQKQSRSSKRMHKNTQNTLRTLPGIPLTAHFQRLKHRFRPGFNRNKFSVPM